MNYETFSEEDLILDESFQDLVRGIDQENNAVWESWLAYNPEKYDLVQNARRVLLDLYTQEKPLPNSEITAAWHKLNAALQQREQADIGRQTGSRSIWKYWRRMVALVVGICLLGSIHWLYTYRLAAFSTQYEQTTSITLPDGPKVVLTELRFAVALHGKLGSPNHKGTFGSRFPNNRPA
jgi:ferric-dicitrate binding protein FerR (iron transport regulator)